MDSVSRLAKKLSASALKFLWSSSGPFWRWSLMAFRVNIGSGLARDVAPEVADDLGLRVVLSRPAGDVVDCRLVKAQPTTVRGSAEFAGR
jgi:hypothetical protein